MEFDIFRYVLISLTYFGHKLGTILPMSLQWPHSDLNRLQGFSCMLYSFLFSIALIASPMILSGFGACSFIMRSAYSSRPTFL